MVIALSAATFIFDSADRSTSYPHYRAIFDDAGGLDPGNEVTLHGRRVGEVLAIGLYDGNAVVTFTVDDNTSLGSETTAAIQPETETNTTGLILYSLGRDMMSPGDAIPLGRTRSYLPSGGPYEPGLGDRARQFFDSVQTLDELASLLSDDGLRIGAVILDAGIIAEHVNVLRRAIEALRAEFVTLSVSLAELRPDKEDELRSVLTRLDTAHAELGKYVDRRRVTF